MGVVNSEVECDVFLVLLYFMNKEDFGSRVEADSNCGPHSRIHTWDKDVERKYVKHRQETRLTLRPIHCPCKQEPHLIDRGQNQVTSYENRPNREGCQGAHGRCHPHSFQPSVKARVFTFRPCSGGTSMTGL